MGGCPKIITTDEEVAFLQKKLYRYQKSSNSVKRRNYTVKWSNFKRDVKNRIKTISHKLWTIETTAGRKVGADQAIGRVERWS